MTRAGLPFIVFFIALLVLLLLIGAEAQQGTCVQGASALSCAGSAYAANARCTAWCFNRALRSATISGAPLLDVQDATATTGTGGAAFIRVNTTGIPGYFTEMTAELQARLNARPRAATDFVTGRTTAAVGDVVAFGADIGYRATGCALGYWPPGPMCPGSQTANNVYVPLAPAPATRTCYTGLGPVGVLVNGVYIFNFWDGQRYRSNRWLNVAVRFEAYDLDICEGHSAGDQYHHHGLSPCLQRQLGDYPGGEKHSPVYGFAADGYAIYGPWQARGELARSCWKTRDYAATSPTGCSVAGQRSCVLVDQFDTSKGVTTLASNLWGPRTDQNVTSQSGNTISAVSGTYFEDYYFDRSCATSGDAAALDQYNGHDHDDLGYHYHVTVAETGRTEPRFVDVFPGWFGPGYKGALGSQQFHPRGGTCGSFPTVLQAWEEPEHAAAAHQHGARRRGVEPASWTTIN